ncbi:hypothetical protein AB670_02258 [Chryseobacterium sp. MOF25P]|uniref:hypothetical protein n=1 Tax=unclassified Chryseobacterium TaxID=2593645 RepID=UPI0008057386|nr:MULTISPECIES: hypothetical protein [unclassified Chryseobacterium]OBW41463.1 hypothetical protein AB670_02258 [Chryseobacterium sp. MOF25P]OBW46042.1 hypothetical protein AB671_01687 [Chryseobacterium sp. BGARF1]
MKINKILISIFLLIIVGCKENNTETKKSIGIDTAKIQKTDNSSTNSNELNGFIKESIVISCGSGCAISYSPENIHQLGHKIEVKFNVEMYEDEVVTDTYKEIYTFIYDDKYNLLQVKSEGENKNYLDTLNPDARESFVNFGNGLIKNKSNANETKTSAYVENRIKLPYNKTINLKTIKYNVLDSGYFKGITKFICDPNNPRYLPLPQKDDIEVILVPQDCGDFPYRFYLLTIKNNNVIGNLYVEGEWYEPDDEENKEISSFSIDKNYNIKVETKFLDSFKSDIYKISDNGKIIKQ